MAMIYKAGETVEEIVKSIEEVLPKVVAISITIAVRDSKYAGERIKKSEYLGFVGKELVAHHKNLVNVIDKIYQKCNLQEREILTVFVGSGTTPIEQTIVEKYTKRSIQICIRVLRWRATSLSVFDDGRVIKVEIR